MTYEGIKELIALIDKSSLTEFQCLIDNTTLRMSKNKSPMAETVIENRSTALVQQSVVETSTEAFKDERQVTEDEVGTLVKAPIVGTFYSSAGAGKEDFVKVGSKVKEGETICILEAMKIMNEITAPCDGEIVSVYVENEEMVEYGKQLFRIQ